MVLEERQIGRQIFCAGRRPLGPADDELLVAPPGLYTQPALEQDDFDRSLMLSLCVVALRLDVVRYDTWHDPLTGLYDRRSSTACSTWPSPAATATAGSSRSW